MNRVTRWEWHGNSLVLSLLCLSVILLPVGIVYFMTKLLQIEETFEDATNLSDFLSARGGKGE